MTFRIDEKGQVHFMPLFQSQRPLTLSYPGRRCAGPVLSCFAPLGQGKATCCRLQMFVARTVEREGAKEINL